MAFPRIPAAIKTAISDVLDELTDQTTPIRVSFRRVTLANGQVFKVCGKLEKDNGSQANELTLRIVRRT